MDQHFQQSRHRGYTLFELVLTMLIIGIIAAIAVPTIGQNLGQPRLKTATNVLAADIEFVMSECITRPDSRRYLNIDVASNQYSVVDDTGATIVNPADGQSYINNFTSGRSAQFKGVTLVSATAGSNALTSFCFTPYGRPDTTGDVAITLAYNGQQMRVTIAQASGAITITRLN